jgi:hypothetical protein
MESKWYVSRPSNSRPLVVLHHADDGEDLSVCLRISNAETVGSDCENPWLGYAYCVEGPASATTSVKPTATNPGLTSLAQSGIASNCDEYYTVVSGDLCSEIETRFDITFAQLYQWNRAIGSNCESLWVGYAVCVAVSS